jgi:hypothetical protein
MTANREDETMSPETIEDVLTRFTPRWMAVPGVVGTGVGDLDGSPCIKVFIAKQTRHIEREIPEKAGGFPVIVELSGEIKPFDDD